MKRKVGEEEPDRKEVEDSYLQTYWEEYHIDKHQYRGVSDPELWEMGWNWQEYRLREHRNQDESSDYNIWK